MNRIHKCIYTGREREKQSGRVRQKRNFENFAKKAPLVLQIFRFCSPLSFPFLVIAGFIEEVDLRTLVKPTLVHYIEKETVLLTRC